MGERDEQIAAGFAAPGEYVPSGEAQGIAATFSAADIASAFGIQVERVHNALAGEFGANDSARIDSQQAQHLAEVLLVDSPQAEREAALMKLGAFTPRPDHEWGVGEAAPWEESDRVVGDDDHVSQH
jgi:hypothetical protein